MVLRRVSEEERAARDAAKQARRDQGDFRRRIEAEQTRLRKREEDREKARSRFQESAAGQARQAFERGDRLFQCSFDLHNTTPVVLPLMAARTATSSTDPTVILNAICGEGWDLVNGSFVFHELGSESRDRFMASGQHVAVKGTVIGYYLFRRYEPHMQRPAYEWDTPPMDRACPSCGDRIPAESGVCVFCGEPSAGWQWNEHGWWRQVDGHWVQANPEQPPTTGAMS